MKKNIFKKIVASLATVAMAAGIFTAMPAEETKAANDYYLIGYINGADYGCEKDWENLGEYKFVDGSEEQVMDIDISAIKVNFPSPAALNMSNLTEQLQAADTNADFIASNIVVPKTDGSNEEERSLLKSKILKDLVPSIDWEKYTKMLDAIKREKVKETISNPPQPEEGGDMYGGY